MAIVNASRGAKTVADPIAEYESLLPMWRRSRALCGGEKYVKDYDAIVDTTSFKNLLIPFSPSMSQQQFDFFKAEAELPGITAEFSKMLVGGLLRKQPVIELPEDIDEGAIDWLKNTFNQDDSSMLSFLDQALWEEIQTSRTWVYVDYPVVNNSEALTPEEQAELKPYPVLWKAETVINWATMKDKRGKIILSRVITRGYEPNYNDNEFHATFVETVRVHELDEEGFFQIRVFQQNGETNNVKVVNGQRITDTSQKPSFDLVEVIDNILIGGERLRMIPAWPLNGQIIPAEPMLTPIIDKEINLYNKMSRRNHLLYSASTYTPIIASDMTDEDFEDVVGKGLGTWIKLRVGDSATVLETPTAALQDMDRAIAATIEEMAKLGLRMLSPESAQSGVALLLRNAAQTARLSSLSNKISSTMQQVIAFMLSWRYLVKVEFSEITFKLSEDFNVAPFDANWLRLVTEWYQQGLIPRSVWLQLLKQNDILAPEYDDDAGREEITADLETTMQSQGSSDFASQVNTQV